MSQITFFPPEIGSRLNMADFDDVVIVRSVQRHLGMRMAGARITLRAKFADEETTRDLDYAVGEPILTMQMLYRTAEGRPVELTIAKHRADRFSITYDLSTRGDLAADSDDGEPAESCATSSFPRRTETG